MIELAENDGAPLATGRSDFVEDGPVYLAVAQRVDCEDSIVDMGPQDKDLTCEIYLNSQSRGKLLLGRIEAHVIDRHLGQLYGWRDEQIFGASTSSLELFHELYRGQPQSDSIAASSLAKGLKWYENVLLIESVEILPEFRGHNFSLRALHGLIHQLRSDIGLVALRLFPKQLQLELSMTRVGSADRLARHFALLGFCCAPGAAFMLLHPSVRLPLAGDLRAASRKGYPPPGDLLSQVVTRPHPAAGLGYAGSGAHA